MSGVVGGPRPHGRLPVVTVEMVKCGRFVLVA